MTAMREARWVSNRRLTSFSSTFLTREHGQGEPVICAPLFLGTAKGGDHRGEH